MAKRKTPKASKPSKISNEHLDNVQKVINDINRSQIEIGQIETRKHNLLHNIAGLNDQLTLIRDEFEKEYGTTDINIQTGEINNPENGKTN